MNVTAADAYLGKAKDRHLEQLISFLRIPSVSALPAHRPDIGKAANWLAERLRTVGASNVQLMQTAGNPVVYGHWHAGDRLPTVLVYGHYDVQPVDPLNEWTSPPFDPAVREDRLFARGASDDKGALFVVLAALDAVRELGGKPPVNLKFMVEGEEEVGSPNLLPFIREHRGLLEADVTMSADGSMLGVDTPSVSVGNRGLAGVQIDVRGARTDLHSGTYGGTVANPVHALAELLAGMHEPNGRVRVHGFYDGVREPSDADRREIAAVPFDENAYRSSLGLAELVGEPEYTPVERTWIRPTLEINGVWGGFQGEGIKTVLPAEAHAKITCRLVPGQEPERIIEAIAQHVRRHTPAGVAVTVTPFQGRARAYIMPSTYPGLTAAARALKDVYGTEPVRVRTGGTLPVSEMIQSELGQWLVFFAFGEADNGAHGPNEFFRLKSFDRGTRATVRFFEELGRLEPGTLRAR
jgi:acetylornithine deacetylase/succinyl-diaminopimelate desuccinylase-like protein